MRTLMVSVCAFGLLAAEAGPAAAAWDNVFQTTLFGRCHKKQTTAAYVAAPVVAYSAPCTSCATPAPAPCSSCNTTYSQRCYYQPVTVMQTQTFYEPVTSYRTSYFYEPVTSYTYTSFYDACSCSVQQVATPVTSYQLRAQQCPVKSWVQRCASVPVTTYQKACYWQPQTTCCQTTMGALIPAVPAQAQPVVPYSPPPITNPPPVIQENQQRQNTQPPPVINDNQSDNRYYQPRPMNFPQAPVTRPPASPPPPAVKLDRIVVGPDARVEGQVVRSDNTPRPNARVMFISADRLAPNLTIYANHAGRFDTTLAPGGWLVYLDAPDGTQIYHSRIDVNPDQAGRGIKLVSR